MKRENYRILLEGKIVQTKHAWNSARRAITAIVGDIARSENQYYTLVSGGVIRLEEEIVAGHQIWKGSRTGREVTLEIRKDPENE